jgi:hypothetical protein
MIGESPKIIIVNNQPLINPIIIPAENIPKAIKTTPSLVEKTSSKALVY